MSDHIDLPVPPGGRFILSAVSLDNVVRPVALIVLGTKLTIGQEPHADIPIEGRINDAHALLINLFGIQRLLPLWNRQGHRNWISVDGRDCEYMLELGDRHRISFSKDETCRWEWRRLAHGAAHFSTCSGAISRVDGQAIKEVLIMQRRCQIPLADPLCDLLQLSAELTIENSSDVLTIRSEEADLICESQLDRDKYGHVDIDIAREPSSFMEQLKFSAIDGKSLNSRVRLTYVRASRDIH